MAESMPILVELIQDRAKLPLSREQWNALCAGNETNTVFQTFEWFDAWWNAFGAEHALFFLVLRQAHVIVGFAPFMLRRITRGRTQLQFVGTGNADYQDVVAPKNRAAAIAAICRFLGTHMHRWDRVLLSNVPEESSTWRLLKEVGGEAGLHVLLRSRTPCPLLRLGGREDAVLRLINKYSIRRPLNWFSRNGSLRFRHLRSWADIQQMLPRFFDQHSERWHATGSGSTLFDDSRQRQFYAELARQAHEADWLLFSVLELNDQPIAFHFGFDYRRSVLWYKPSFDVRFADHSPGLLLIRQLIEDALQRSRDEMDFTIGDEFFKGRFASHKRSNVDLALYHSRLSHAGAVVTAFARRRVGRLWRAVRDRPTAPVRVGR